MTRTLEQQSSGIYTVQDLGTTDWDQVLGNFTLISSALSSLGTASAHAASDFDAAGAAATVAAEIPAASSVTPAMDGAAAVGTSTTFARADHVHPSDTSRVQIAPASYCLSFPGTVYGPVVKAPVAPFQLSSGAYSISIWYKSLAASYPLNATLIGTAQSVDGWQVGIQGGVLGFIVSPSTSLYCALPADTNWHHVAVTWDGSICRLYLDGVQVAQSSASFTPVTAGGYLYFGGDPNLYDGYSLNGTLDEAAIWSRALSAAEVGILHASAAVARSDPAKSPWNSGLIAGWHFDEGTGTTTADYSGNGHTATLDTSALWAAGGVPFGVNPGGTSGQLQYNANGGFGGTTVVFNAALSSLAEGNSTTAGGLCSHAEGEVSSASGRDSHAEGLNGTAPGFASHVEGTNGNASGDYSHAEGSFTTASGGAAHAEGGNNTASGNWSHVEGGNNAASGNYSHAEGGNSAASGEYGHAEGVWTVASGDYGSHAEGNGSHASGTMSHAEGAASTASGSAAHAEGSDTTASADNSSAGGSCAKAMQPAGWARASGDFSAAGDSQHTLSDWQGATSDATPTALSAFVLETGKTYSMKINILAASPTDVTAWVYHVLLYGTTCLENLLSTLHSTSLGSVAFSVAGGTFVVTGTGTAATAIRWHVLIDAVELVSPPGGGCC
ncbi:MAG: LamG-like jellyroll fold domain-containing protein [Thermoguttaceae bacterium]|jgi:hypothetical protein